MEKPTTAIARDYMKVYDKVIDLESDYPKRYISFIDMLRYRTFKVSRPLYETSRVCHVYIDNTKSGDPGLDFSVFNNQYHLPYAVDIFGKLSSKASTAYYGEDGRLRRMVTDTGGPSIPTGSFDLDVYLPIIDITLEESHPTFKIRQSSMDYKNLYASKRLLLTETLETIDRSKACFRHGILETKAAITSKELKLEVNRPDGLQIITNIPTHIGSLDYIKMSKGDPHELMKLPTNEFRRLYRFDNADMGIPIEITD